MAKTKTQIPKPVTNQIANAINSKKEKPNGEKWELTEPFKFYGQAELPEGTIFTECNDGFYKITTPEKEIEHYRVSIKNYPNLKLKKYTP